MSYGLFGRCLVVVGALLNACHAADRPNVVWLVSEDNSKHYLKLFDPNGADTPQLAKLASEGLLFEHAFSNSPVCSVARTTLITGCYAPRIGTQFHRASVRVPLPEGVRMFPASLRDAGYFTANNQKKDYNAIEGERVWDESSRRASWRNRPPGSPFFYMQSFGASHESSLHFPPDDLVSHPPETDPNSVRLAPYHPDTPTFRYTAARYHDRIRQIDREVGAVVAQLAEDGLLEDTFIFYFGDHGGVLPRSKGYLYESGLHVPLVIRIPENWQHRVDAARGSRVQGFVSFVDFAPTVLNLAGVDIPSQLEGRPFLGPGVSLSELNQRDEAFGYADRFDEKYDLVRSLRKGRFKYIRNYQPFNFDGLQNNYRYQMLAYQEWRELFATDRLTAMQRQFFLPRPAETLFDLASDPDETQNLADHADFDVILQDLRQRLAARVKALPDLSFYPESELVAEARDDPARFGRTHQAEIARLVDVADLSLKPYAEARSELRRSLAAENPWERYWALIVCSSFGQAAAEFATVAEALAERDPESLVRVRAAEFLGLIGQADPSRVILRALYGSSSPVEAALILNSIVLLQDGSPGYQFAVDPDRIAANVRRDDKVERRLKYLRNELE